MALSVGKLGPSEIIAPESIALSRFRRAMQRAIPSVRSIFRTSGGRARKTVTRGADSQLMSAR
jgi:hypothetical protein